MPRPVGDLTSKYKLLTKTVLAQIKPLGFRIRGTRAWRDYSGNWEIVRIYSARKWRDATQVGFNVSVGLRSAAIRRIDGYPEEEQDPTGALVDLSATLGQLLPTPNYDAYELQASDSAEQMALSITRDLLTYGIPFLEKYRSDEALFALWRSGTAFGISEFLRLMKQCVFLKMAGDRTTYEAIRAELESPRFHEQAKAVARTFRKLDDMIEWAN